MTRERMVKDLLCPGCVVGSDTRCGSYDPKNMGCAGHVLGTTIFPMGITLALGMPKGFNRGGTCSFEKRYHNQMYIRLFPEGELKEFDGYDDFNVPVWALEQDGFLFVRVAQPRLGNWMVDVFEGGTREKICPNAIDISSKYDQID